ncbi:MAG: glycosyltransferase, partial [Candidatus Neomarinimicrobiota bacterium]
KKERQDPLSKRLPSRLFNFTVRLATGVPIHDSNCGLKAYRSPVVKNLEVYGGLHRYIPALAKYKGFRVTEKVVRHRPRLHGKTKYGAARYLHGLLDLLTVLFLGRYFQRPLHFFGLVGLSVMGAGLGISIYLTINWFGGIPIGNRPLFFLGILAIIVGIQFLSLGLIAELIVQRGQREQRRVKEEYPPRR